MPDPAPKLTRAEAARRNGARSRGPTSPEGKRRSARNAVKHGLTAQSFTLIPGEDADAYAALLTSLARRYRPGDALAAHLVQRLALVMWRQNRADRLEAEVLVTREQRPDSSYLGGYLPGSPPAWDAARFNAVQRQQARLDRTLFRLIDELERLGPAAEDDAANDNANEPNEPEEIAPAAVVAEPPAPPPRPEVAARPTSGEVLPLTPELRALLGRTDEDAWRLFGEGRIRQVNDFLRAAGRPDGSRA